MTQLKHAEYRPRLVDDLVDDFLSTFGAVQIDGPKYCGKTWTAEAHAGSAIHLDRGEARHLVEADPQVAIVGEQPRLIDEWQEAPKLWDAVRFALDRNYAPGRFILTGSASVPSVCETPSAPAPRERTPAAVPTKTPLPSRSTLSPDDDT